MNETNAESADDRTAGGSMPPYVRFGLMILTSTVVMYALMYLNTYALDHVVWSETRVYMALIMGACMAVIMLSFMLHMHRKTKVNLAIYGGSVALFAVALWLVRSQSTVQDVSYMKAMIPHHSIAIMTSERAQISDPRVRELADEIILAQRREIAMMKQLIADLEGTGVEDVGVFGTHELEYDAEVEGFEPDPNIEEGPKPENAPVKQDAQGSDHRTVPDGKR
jgi:hypothetical protein